VGESGYLHLHVDGVSLEADESKGSDKQPAEGAGEALLLASVPGHAAFSYRIGDDVKLRLRAERCHAFDAQTGVAIRKQDAGAKA